MTGLRLLAARPIGASAKKRAGLPTRSKVGARPVIICPCTGVRLDARPGQGRPRGAVRRSRTGASAKKHARKSCNLSWNWIFVLIIRPCKGADRRPAFPALPCRSAENAQPSHGAYHPGRMPRQGRSSGPDEAAHEARTKLAPGMKLNSSMRISSTISRSKRLLTATLISSSIISRSTSSSAAKSRSGSE